MLSEEKYFEAHDALEPSWMAAEGDLKTALQGLIQIAAGLHKRQRGEAAGADYLIERGVDKVKRTQSSLPPDIVSLFIRAATA